MLGEVLKEFAVKISLAFDKKKVTDAKKDVAALGTQMKALAFEVSAAATTMLGFAAIASHNDRDLQQTADMLGINVEKFQELEFAAKVAAGVSRGELTSSLEGLSKTLFEARAHGGDAAEALIRLGVSADTIYDPAMTADKLLGKLADRFQGMPDGIYKTALANEVGGASLVKLLPLLGKGSAGIAQYANEARALGVVLGKDVVDQGAEFDRQFTKIWIVLKNLAYTIGNELIKYLRPIVTEFQRWIAVNKQFVASGIAAVMKAIGSYLSIIFQTTKFVVDRFRALVEVLGGVGRVSEVIAVALGAITGFKILSGLGTLITSWRALAAVFGVASLPLAGIGAAFLGIILVVQDLMSKDSIIKEWFNKLTDLAWEPVKAFDAWIDRIEKMAEKLGPIADLVKMIHDLLPDASGTGDQGFMTHGDAKQAKGMGGQMDWMQRIQAGSAATAVPTSASPQNGGGDMKSVQIHAPIHINVPGGTSAEDAVKIASDGAAGGLEHALRQTRNQALNPVAY